MSGDHFCLIGASHHTVPLDIRERLSIPDPSMPNFLHGALKLDGVRECVLLNTCNRLEIYAAVDEPTKSANLLDYYCQFQGFDQANFKQIHFSLAGVDALRHLMEVASGVDSQIVGETEVFGQVKDAYSEASRQRTAGSMLNRIFQKSFQASKWIRTHTAIGTGQVSIATVSVDLAIKIYGDLSSTRVLVIGAGDIGEKTLKALKSRRARDISITNRTFARAENMAREFGARALPYEGLNEYLRDFDIIIASTASPDIVLSYNAIEQAQQHRRIRPLFLIDLALPRDIDASVAGLDNIFLYNLDDLAKIAEENLAFRVAETARCRELIRQKADQVWKLIPAHKSAPADNLSVPSRTGSQPA